MADFPTTKPSLSGTEYGGTTPLPTTHPTLHNDINEEIDALVDKVGVDSSTDTDSVDYKLTSTSSSDPGHKHTLANGATDVTATADEVNIMDGVTATAAELNIMSGVTSSTADLNATTNFEETISATTSEITVPTGKTVNITDNSGLKLANTAISATAAELNIMSGVTASTADLNATTNFEETISATTSEITVPTGKTVNITDNSGLKLASTAISATAAELNITDGGQTAEKVLNVQSKARVYMSATQSNIADKTAIQIEFDTESYDIGSDFDVSDYAFTAPVSGYYLVNLFVFYTGIVAGGTVYTQIFVNSSLRAGSKSHTSSTNSLTTSVTDIIYVVAAQEIEFYAYVNIGVATADILANMDYTYASIHLLSI